MFHRWILISSLLTLEILVVRTILANSLSKAGDAVDEDDDYSLVVSRGRDILSSTQTQAGHYREITVTLTAFNETFVLDLQLNTYFLASTYVEKAVTNSGEVYNDVNHVTGHCYYTGEIRNKSESTAAVSTCKGITGYFAIGNVSYHIESKSDDLNGQHRVFRNRDDDGTTFTCGTEDQPRWMWNDYSTPYSNGSNRRLKRSFLYPQDADRVDKVVEVYVANDYSQYRSQSSNVQEVYRRTKDIVNIASLLYQPLGIYLVLVGVEVWTDGDRFSILGSDVDGALSKWHTYRQNSINPSHQNDNGVLITNVVFDNRVVGKTIPGWMCSNSLSGFIVSDIIYQAAFAGTLFAHEMGHSFGLTHDNLLAQCSCDDAYTNNQCIMYSSTNADRPSTKWSDCSTTQLDISFSQGLDLCLYNIPQTIFQPSSTCGNGIIEDGEQCDCGKAPSSECNSTCCNSVTCQLSASASCAYGRCCNISRCQVKSSGTECRSKSNDCDLPESCDGVDARCPTDSYKPDGTDCTHLDSAYCYQGQCRSHRSQCELLWGPGTQASDDVCYTRYNVDAEFWGNCGMAFTSTGANYIACATKDVLCGRLFCQDNKRVLPYYTQFNWGSKSYVGSASCRLVEYDFGISTQDPGLVPNGARCGDRQMCVNQTCVNVIVPTITTSTASSSSPTSSTTPTASTTKPTRSRVTPLISTTKSPVSLYSITRSLKYTLEPPVTKRHTPVFTRP